MKRALVVLLIAVSFAFALPTLYGTRGTNLVSSARCEDMGYLWFYPSLEGYLEDVIILDTISTPGDTLRDTFDVMAANPIRLSLGFTPWHYLEFSIFGNAYFIKASDPDLGTSVSVFDMSDVGGHVKGSIPFTPLDAPTVIALGLDGFFLMTLPFEMDQTNNDSMAYYLGYNPYNQAGAEFGGKLLFSVESQYFSGHLNAGYWYRSQHMIGGSDGVAVQYPQTIVSGIGLESSPMNWLNLFADFNVDYGLTIMNADTLLAGLGTHASVGVRFPIMMGKNKGFGLMFTVAGGADPMNFGSTMSLYAGLAIGGDLIPEKEVFVEGTVYDSATGQTIPDAAVTIKTAEGDTVIYSDSLGNFTLPELEGDEIIYVEKDGYHGETVTADEILSGEYNLVEDTKLSKIQRAWLAGTVEDAETSEPLEAMVVFEKLEEDTVIDPLTTDPITGYFRLELPPGTYNITTSAEGYHDDERSLVVMAPMDTLIDVTLTPIEEPAPPPPLYPATLTGFGEGSTTLTMMQIMELEKIVEIMVDNPDATVVLVGHTDSVGSDAANLRVGARRAGSVYEFLRSRGIAANRISIETGGERFPIGDNRYRSGRDANRRVDFYFSRATTEEELTDSEHGVKPPTTK
ncbi:OmpA family protein [candidate division WOR-3 bacterium]|uniref:OmpA family protein n=1 Tax=candidate division WOR-3 bacterium TaxID=2052148 RepID=A0A9D5QBU7_UNCW3|nr:OmpA family protein [candidate division WOR-3 bacterium]MBD3363973.1 OmpA family protein [candidate division WOR-3 bacterium]